jgi:Protein of unknown function (DUF2815)
MPMMHSRMTDEWLAAVVRGNPIRIAEKTGNIITCPVRLQYVNLFKPAKPQKGDSPDKKPSYNTVCCLPPGVEAGINNIMRAAVYAEERKSFPNNFGPDGRSFGLHDPLRGQHEKMRTQEGKEVKGFTPGLLCFTAGTQIKPVITDAAFNPIVDESRVYPGVWAIVALNVYPYKNKISGVNFGLQSIMIFADDEKTGGVGGSNPKDDFDGVQIDQAYNPTAAFGNTPVAPPAYAPPASIMPPAQPVYQPPATPTWTPPAPPAEESFW